MRKWKLDKTFQKAVFLFVILCLSHILFAARSMAADVSWHVKDAPIRFKVSLGSPPSHGSAGYIVKLPDGGILPTPAPAVVVIDENGNELKSGCLWHDPEKGLGIVFEAPDNGKYVHVYARKSKTLSVWTPASGLTPSIVVYIRSGTGDRAAARQLANIGASGKGVYFGRLRNSSNDLSLGGDITGHIGPYSAYVLGYLASKDPGRTWIAPMSLAGSLDIAIDGNKIHTIKISNKSGGTGQWVDISKNLHRIEAFHFLSDGKNCRYGNMLIAWKTPHATMEELGGTRPANLSDAGTSMWAARAIQDDECVQSGKGAVKEIQAQDGSPVASFTITPTDFVNFEGQSPIILYTLEARKTGNPENTIYTWSLGDSATITGKTQVNWLFAGHRDHRVTLTVSSGNKRSQCAYPFYAFCNTISSDINSLISRRDFRAGYLEIFKAYPLDKDPTATWDSSMWDLFFRLIEPGQGKALLAHIFSERWTVMRNKLDEQNRWLIEDTFFAMACPADPQQAMNWVDEFEKFEKNAQRRNHWKLKRIELLMYYLDDLKEAERQAGAIASMFSPIGIRAQIRLGDIALLRGDNDEAIRLYGEAQNRVKHSKQVADKQQQETRLSSGLARSTAELKKQREAGKASLLRKPSRHAPVDDWRIGVVRDTAISETVRSLIRQGYYLEAEQALEEWEMEFPMAKISGDYIVAKAGFLMNTGDFIQTRRILKAYCKAVDMTNYLPEAMKLTIDCMLHMHEPDEAIKDFIMETRKRFEHHAFAKELDTMLELLKHGKEKRQPTRDTL